MESLPTCEAVGRRRDLLPTGGAVARQYGAGGRQYGAGGRQWAGICVAAAATLVGGVMVSPLAAQSTGWRGNAGLRPVPQARSSTMASSSRDQATAASPTQRPGWNLQWRTSPQIAAQQARRVSDAAFAQAAPTPSQQRRSAPADNDAQTPRIVATASDASRDPAAQSPHINRLRPAATANVRQVAWTNPQSESPSGGFSLPENEFRGTAETPPSSADRSLSGPSLQAPNHGAAEELPPPASAPSISAPSISAPGAAPGNPPGNTPGNTPGNPPGLGSPRGNAPSDADPGDKLEDLFGFGPTTDQRSAGPRTAPAQPGGDGSSIRDMIEGESAEPSLLQPAPSPPQNLQVLPPGTPIEESQDSPSDLESFAPNPFENRDRNLGANDATETEQDRRDRDRLDSGGIPDIFGTNEEGPTNSGTGLSCDEFRERIRSATIDQVSLDPSPPFRPDVIDMKEFDKLKDRFNENQVVRTWRSIDGRPMGTGRLNDLAYGKAVIQTEFDTTEELSLNQLSEADLAYISQNWGLPTECLIEQVAFTPRQWTPTTMTYAASNLCHKPLYFEEVNLERYGHTAGPLAQPVISSAHFFLNIAVLPYKMGVHSPQECQYALGYYRPGNCAPWIIPPVPLSVRGAWYQATAVTGTALLIP